MSFVMGILVVFAVNFVVSYTFFKAIYTGGLALLL